MVPHGGAPTAPGQATAVGGAASPGRPNHQTRGRGSVAVIVVVAAPVIVTVHVHGNATVGVIEWVPCVPGWVQTGYTGRSRPRGPFPCTCTATITGPATITTTITITGF
jgi:hypothetical protein